MTQIACMGTLESKRDGSSPSFLIVVNLVELEPDSLNYTIAVGLTGYPTGPAQILACGIIAPGSFASLSLIVTTL